MSWITQSERIDYMLHEEYTRLIREAAIGKIAQVLIEADREQKKHNHREKVLAAVRNCQYRVALAAKDLGVSRETIYKEIRKKDCQPETEHS